MTGSADAKLQSVRRAIEGLCSVRWEDQYPRIHPRGGWDVAFYVGTAPDAETFERWSEHLRREGLHPCI